MFCVAAVCGFSFFILNWFHLLSAIWNWEICWFSFTSDLDELIIYKAQHNLGSCSQGQKQNIHVQPPRDTWSAVQARPCRCLRQHPGVMWKWELNWAAPFGALLADRTSPPTTLLMKCFLTNEGGVTQVGGGLLPAATGPISASGAFAWQPTKISHRCFIFPKPALRGGRANRRLWKALKTLPCSVRLT